ncbi:uncharacterized protein TRAVEDRAFT_32305, partial [Trametes versicolor FP-101664 SS1]
MPPARRETRPHRGFHSTPGTTDAPRVPKHGPSRACLCPHRKGHGAEDKTRGGTRNKHADLPMRRGRTDYSASCLWSTDDPRSQPSTPTPNTARRKRCHASQQNTDPARPDPVLCASRQQLALRARLRARLPARGPARAFACAWKPALAAARVH